MRMIIECRKCGRILKTGEEIKYTAIGAYQELPSKVIFSVSQPHDVLVDTLEHVDCLEGDQ
jgi:hypothetical protein